MKRYIVLCEQCYENVNSNIIIFVLVCVYLKERKAFKYHKINTHVQNI